MSILLSTRGDLAYKWNEQSEIRVELIIHRRVQMQMVTADDNDPVIRYEGFSAVEAQDNAVVQLQPQRDYKGSLSMTASANASASFRFRGELGS